jgi:hypothetical protein
LLLVDWFTLFIAAIIVPLLKSGADRRARSASAGRVPHLIEADRFFKTSSPPAKRRPMAGAPEFRD